MGASGAQEAGGPVSSSAQRGAQQDFGQTVAVGNESQLSINLLSSLLRPNPVFCYPRLFLNSVVQWIKTLKQDYRDQIKDGGGENLYVCVIKRTRIQHISEKPTLKKNIKHSF